jgi:hypothetical protein
MDNIFEILIYAFIIISFLSSLFRKKKTETKRAGEIPEPPLKPEAQPKTSQQEEYDLLKEIEKMFKMETPTEEKQEDRSFERGEERFERASEHLDTTYMHKPTPSEHKPSVSEHRVESWEEKNRKAEEKRKAVNKKILDQAMMFEKHLIKKRGEENYIKNKIKQSLKDPKSLKEYIIFSEILGKPKALSKGLFEPE